jgi:hypothetical protein
MLGIVHIHRCLGLKINFIYLNFIVLLFLLSSMHHTFVNFLVQNAKGRLCSRQTISTQFCCLKYAAIISYQRPSVGHKPSVTIGTRPGVIYSRLFTYTQQHTAGFTESSIGPVLNVSKYFYIHFDCPYRAGIMRCGAQCCSL